MTQVAGTIEVNHGGTIYRASYSVKDGKVHILTPLGRKVSKVVGGAAPEEVARIMLKGASARPGQPLDPGQTADHLKGKG
jgi:hypothetical protein